MKKPEILDFEEEGEKKEEKKEELPYEIEDLEEEISLSELVGKTLILTNAEITEGAEFNVIHLTFLDGDKTIYARTTSKAIENTIKRLLDKGLGKGKAFRVCVTSQMSRYKKEMYLLAPPSVCEKKK